MQSISEIESYYEEREKIFKVYLTDIKTKRAIERNIEIIGEAVNRILKKYPDFKLNHARQIIGTRNRIIHGYQTVTFDSIVIDSVKVFQRTYDAGERINKVFLAKGIGIVKYEMNDGEIWTNSNLYVNEINKLSSVDYIEYICE